MSKTHTDGLNVLIVEDDEDAATVEALLLGMENHDVTIASDGPAALREVQQGTPDVILLDLGLPGIDGLEIARRIRQMHLPKRPMLIAVTGRSDVQDVRRSREVGIDVHLVKPVAPDKLCLLMRHVCRVIR
jgi:DNA-binding response OmpR family regulator